jgi:hypothetical protein
MTVPIAMRRSTFLAKEMKSQRDPVARSYDYFRKIDYFASGNEVSRARLQNLVHEMKALGDIGQHCYAVDHSTISRLKARHAAEMI